MSATPSADANALIHLLRQLDNLRFGELKPYDGSILEKHGKDILIDLTRCLNHYMIRHPSTIVQLPPRSHYILAIPLSDSQQKAQQRLQNSKHLSGQALYVKLQENIMGCPIPQDEENINTILNFSPKMAAVDTIIRRFEDEKCLIFCNLKNCVKYVEICLRLLRPDKSLGFIHEDLIQQLAPEKTSEDLQRVKRGEFDVVTSTYGSGSVGLNL